MVVRSKGIDVEVKVVKLECRCLLLEFLFFFVIVIAFFFRQQLLGATTTNNVYTQTTSQLTQNTDYLSCILR